MEQHTSLQTEAKLDSLTGARGIAIFIIVLSHLEFLKDYFYGEVYWRFFHNATLGVDYYFMLSGFGMMLSCMRKGGNEAISIASLFEYGKRHVKKIYKLYVITLFVGIPYSILENIEFGKPVLFSIIKNILKLIPGLTLLQSATGMVSFSHVLNPVCWFLSTLFCIYLVSPIIMKLLTKTVKNERSALLLISLFILASCVLAKLFLFIEGRTFFDDLCYGSPYRRVFYVAGGMVCAQLYSFRKSRSGSFAAAAEYVSCIAALLWFSARISVGDRMGCSVYAVDMILCLCVLYTLAVGKGKIAAFLRGKGMVFLGNLSMYIFLTHLLIRLYTDYFVRSFHLKSAVTGVLEVVFILLTTMAVSAALYNHDRRKQIKSGI